MASSGRKYHKEEKMDVAKDLAKGVSEHVLSDKYRYFVKLLGISKKKVAKIDADCGQNPELLKNKEAIIHEWLGRWGDYTVREFIEDVEYWHTKKIMKDEVLKYIKDSTRTGRNEEFTDIILLKLSKKFHKKENIRILAVQGLGVNEDDVDAALADEDSKNTAMHAILQKWRMSMTDRYVAFVTIYDALGKVGMSGLQNVLTE